MPKRRADADQRRFFDEFECVGVSRLRATGVIDPAKRQSVIPFPDGTHKLIGTAHVRFPNGGGYSFLPVPAVRQARGRPVPRRRCAAYASDAAPPWASRTAPEWASAGASASAQGTKLSTGSSRRLKPSSALRFKPAPASWGGRCRARLSTAVRSNASMRRRLVELRLCQLATQQASSLAKDGDTLRTYQPTAEAKQLIDIKPIWRASSTEQLQQAPRCCSGQHTRRPQLATTRKQRLAAAKLLLRTKQARERGL